MNCLYPVRGNSKIELVVNKSIGVLPGLTRYAFKEARRYAKLIKAGIPTPGASTHRRRFNQAKVERFIAFITSSQVVSDMPFGHYTLKKDSGDKEEIPNMIRTSVNQRIIAQYQQYLRDTHHADQDPEQELSETTMWRILRACKATTRKSLLGLDYFTYAGLDGISKLIDLLEKIPKSTAADKGWANEAKKTLMALKVFFKGDYKFYIQENSEYQDYSRTYALSHPREKQLQARIPGDPPLRRCAMCIAMLETFKGIQDMIDAADWQAGSRPQKKEAKHILSKAKEGILEWQKHLMRTVHQNEAKEEILQNLKKDSVWVLMDWAMKFLPRKGIESQPEWYAKRGLPWHISVAIARDPDTDKFFIRTYVHIFDPVAQDSETTLAIIRDVIERIQDERPEVRKVYLRSDNAVCYHSGQTIAAIPDISALSLSRTTPTIKIVRYDFSDPQSGKGACDRATSVIKRHVNQFVRESNDCTTPALFLQCGNSHQGVKSVTFIHAGLEVASGQGAKGSIVGITPFHNFDFTTAKIRAWHAYKVGMGTQPNVTPRTLGLPRLRPITVGTRGRTHNEDGGLLHHHHAWLELATRPISATPTPAPTEEGTPPPSTTESSTDGWMPDDDDVDDTGYGGSTAQSGDQDDPVALEGPNRKGLFQCEEEGCSKVFQHSYHWFRHVTVGRHSRRVERQSLRDFSIDKYVENIQRSQALSTLPQVFAAIQSQRDLEASSAGVEALPMGWALKTRRQAKRFTAKQKAYLTTKFNQGATTGIKCNSQEVAQMMIVDPEFPNEEDWLDWVQIQSFWSRLAQLNERRPRDQQRKDMPVPQEEIEVDLEGAADDEYVERWTETIDKTINDVIAEMMARDDDDQAGGNAA